MSAHAATSQLNIRVIDFATASNQSRARHGRVLLQHRRLGAKVRLASSCRGALWRGLLWQGRRLQSTSAGSPGPQVTESTVPDEEGTLGANMLVPQAWLAKQGQSVATLAARRLLHVHILARLALHGGGTHSALQAADGAVLFSRSPRTQPRATPNTAAGTAASRNRATQRNMAGLGRAEGRQ